MRIVAVSDLHGWLPDVPECDLLLLGGDLCPVRGSHEPAAQAKWLGGPFREWLDAAPAKEVVGVAGNHDFVFQKAPHLVPGDLRWTYLQDSGAEKCGLKIWGLPWQPWFYDWAFNATPDKMKAVASLVPDDTDILVMHGPPQGYGDLARRYGAVKPSNGCAPAARDVSYEHVGCPELRDRVCALGNLKLAVFGHIHPGHGVYRLPHADKWYDTLLANVSLVNEEYEPMNGVTLFDYEVSSGALTATVQVSA